MDDPYEQNGAQKRETCVRGQAKGRRPAAGRPRNADADEAILAAASKLLAEDGYDGLSYEAIGKMAGLGRPTIYRRWPTKVHLAAAVAYGDGRAFPEVEGSLRTQIEALVTQVRDLYSRPDVAAASVGLISALRSSEDLREELHTPAENEARTQLRAMVERAKAEGEAREDSDADVLFDTIVGSLIFRLVFSSLPPADDIVTRLSDHLYRAIRV